MYHVTWLEKREVLIRGIELFLKVQWVKTTVQVQRLEICLVYKKNNTKTRKRTDHDILYDRFCFFTLIQFKLKASNSNLTSNTGQGFKEDKKYFFRGYSIVTFVLDEFRTYIY